LPREKETLRLRSAELAIIGVIIALSLFLPIFLSARAEETLAEPSLVTILHTLGYTNIVLSTAQTFPAGAYEARLLAEYAGYYDTNEFSYYPVGTSNFILLFSGPEGNYGYITPPVIKTFSSATTFGCSMYVAAENHRYFTQTSRNPDGRQHARVYLNLDVPGMYFIGFENVYGSPADRDFQDMVISIAPLEHYLSVETEPLGITTIPGEGWYSNGTGVMLVAPDPVSVSTGVRYKFNYWDINGAPQGSGVNPITVIMNANRSARAHYTLQYYLTVSSPYGTPGGQGWYNSGLTAYATLDTATVDCGNGTRRLFTSWGCDASGTNHAASNPILMNAPKTALACWKTQYYLTVTSPYGVPGGQGWYDTGSTVYATLNTDTVDHGNGTRRVFTSWSGDASGTNYAQSNPILMNAPKTATALWKTQYYLTMSTNFGTVSPSDGWHDAGSTFSTSATPPSVVSGERYVWNGWTGTGSGSYTGMNNPTSIAMNAPINEVASWTHQYRLTLATNYGTTTPSVGEHWYDAGSAVEINATAPGPVVDERYVWESWIGTGTGSYTGPSNPVTINMNAPVTETASWTHQFLYYLTVTSLYDSPTPTSDWFDEGTIITASVTSPWGGPAGTRYVCTGWNGTGSVPPSGSVTSVTFTINEPSSITWNWKTQYYLTLITEPGHYSTLTRDPEGVATLSGSDWYDSGTYASISTPEFVDIVPGSSRYKFTGWMTDDMSEIADPYSPSTIVLMDKPKTVTASYKTQYYLTITHTSGGVTSPADSEWYDSGSTASVAAIPDLDYVLTRWELDGSPIGPTNPCSVVMNSTHALHAVFEYSPPPTYYLTVKTDPLGITSISGQSWYDEDENVTLTAPNLVDVSTGTRYKFAYWDIDGTPRSAGANPITVTMNANHTATAHYTLQYYLTVTSPYDTPAPASGWFDAGAPITASVTSPWAGTSGTRYVCTGWAGTGSVPASGTASSVAFTVNAPSNITWNWKTQYYLTIKTIPSSIVTIPGEGWYDKSTTVPLTAPDVTGYEFRYWDLNGTPQGDGVTSISITMNMPYTATARYHSLVVGGSTTTIKLHLTYTWMGINAILATAFCIAAFYTKKRRKKV
jgi:hypothetical protein